MSRLPSIAVPVKRRGTKKAQSATSPETDAAPQAAAAAPGPRPTRPASPAPGAPLRHRYRVGQRLRIVNVGSPGARAAGLCRVVSLVPAERGTLSYRVRNEAENFERIVAEADLAPLEAQLP